MDRALRRFVVTVSVVLLLGATISAQVTSRGTLTGVVTDPSGAVVANATVVLTEPATGVSRHTVTNSAGHLSF